MPDLNWNPKTRAALERLIRRGRGQGLPVVFDFDNTIVRGDIGEATLAVLARSGVRTPQNAPRHASPPLNIPGTGIVRLEDCDDVTQYYEALLSPTAHGDRDPSPLANGYVWAVEVMQGLALSQVVDATREAFESPPGRIEVTPGKSAYPVPVFHPEMVEFIAALLRNGFDVWIVSASNAWSVRWMVLHGLNPLLRAHGVRRGLAPDRVIGVATVLTDGVGRWYKDACLVCEDARYARLDARAIRKFRLTGRVQFPAPTYAGKVAAIFETIGRPPYLSAGDSPGDHAMLRYSRHRLWIARGDKGAYQEATARLIQTTGRAGWLFQSTDKHSGFLPD